MPQCRRSRWRASAIARRLISGDEGAWYGFGPCRTAYPATSSGKVRAVAAICDSNGRLRSSWPRPPTTRSTSSPPASPTNYVLTMLAECIGVGVPVVILPFINHAFAGRRPLQTAVTKLRSEESIFCMGSSPTAGPRSESDRILPVATGTRQDQPCRQVRSVSVRGPRRGPLMRWPSGFAEPGEIPIPLRSTRVGSGRIGVRVWGGQ